MGWAHHTNCPVDLNQEPLLGPLSLLMRICKPEGTSRSPALRDTRLTHGLGTRDPEQPPRGHFFPPGTSAPRVLGPLPLLEVGVDRREGSGSDQLLLSFPGYEMCSWGEGAGRVGVLLPCSGTFTWESAGEKQSPSAVPGELCPPSPDTPWALRARVGRFSPSPPLLPAPAMFRPGWRRRCAACGTGPSKCLLPENTKKLPARVEVSERLFP